MKVLEQIERYKWIAFGLIIAIAAWARFAGISEFPPFIDESGHILYVNELHPSFYQLGKVLGQYLLRPGVNLASDPLLGGRATVAFLGLLTVAGLFFAAREIASKSASKELATLAGLTAALIWATMPFIAFHDRLALHDPMVSVFHVWSIYVLTLAFQRMSPGLAVAGGFLSGMAALVKLPMWVLTGTALVIALSCVRRERWQEMQKLAAFAIGGSLIPFLLLIPHWGVLMSDTGSHVGGLQGFALFFKNIALVTSWLLSYNSIGFLAIILICAALAAYTRDLKRIVLTATFFLPLVGMSAVLSVFTSRYVLAILISGAILVALTLAAELGRGEAEIRRTPSNTALAVLGLALLTGVIARWIGSDWTLIAHAEDASVPADDYRQYIKGWPSGNGVAEVIAFLKAEAAKPGKPLLVSVGVFGRHGAWAVQPRMAGVPNIQFRQGFVTGREDLTQLAKSARTNRVLLMDEPPAYEIPPGVFALAEPAPAQVFVFNRVLPRVGATDGALRLWQLSPKTKVKLDTPKGPPVPASEPPSIESISNPNGMEGSKEKPFYWVGDGATLLTVRSGKAGIVNLKAVLHLGPSLSGKPHRDVLVTTSSGYEEALTLGPGPGSIAVPIEAGRTEIEILALDSPNISALSNGDRRPLLLGMEGLVIEAGGTAGPLRCAAVAGSGIHNLEMIPGGKGWFRWTTGESELRIFSSRPAVLQASGDFLAMTRPERIDVLAENEKVGSIDVPSGQDQLKPFPPFEFSVPAGWSSLRWKADQPGRKPAGDSRVLNFAISNIKMRMKNGGQLCEWK